MPIRMIATSLIFIVVAFSPTLIFAQQSDALKERTRMVYENTSEIPDDVYLSGFLNLLNAKFKGRFAGDLNRLASHVNEKMYLHDVDEALETAKFLTNIATSLNSDVERRIRSTLCPANVSTSFGQEVYSALNSIDDTKVELGRKYLGEIQREFGDYKYSKFLAWMDSRKPTSTLIFFDNAKVNEGRDPELVRQRICSRLGALQTN